MKALLRFVVFVCYILILTDCKSRAEYVAPSFARQHHAKVTILNDKDLEWFAKRIIEYKDYLIVLESDPATKTHLHFFDKYTGNKVADYVPDGRGPGEGVLFSGLWEDTDCYRLVEMMLRKVISFHPDSLLAMGSPAFADSSYEVPPFNLWNYFSKGLQIHLGQTFSKSGLRNQDAVRILVKKNGITSSFNDYPVAETEDKWFLHAHSQALTVSPDRTRMAIGSNYGAILEIFDISDKIHMITTRKFLQPQYKVDKNFDLEYTEQTVACFRDMFSTNDKLYTTYEEAPFVSLPCKSPSGIAVFDWEGNPLELITIEGYGILCFYVNEAERTIYANLQDKDTNYYLAKIVW